MQLRDTEHYIFTYDAENGILKFLWKEATANMTDDDFKDALSRFAGCAEEHKVPRSLVDLRSFKHTMTDELAAWRDQTVAPRYNNAGVKKFAYILPAGAPMPPPEAPPEHEKFVTRFFDSEEKAQEWLLES